MAKKPTKIRWPYSKATQAKHRILKDYLAAWVPILGQLPDIDDLILIDGFAGPGRHEGDERGSPLLMVDAYARAKERKRFGVTAHFFFIEENKDRAEALQEELEKRKKVPDIDWRVIRGEYDVEYPKLPDEINERFPESKRAIFSFIDPFGAEQNRLELTRQLLDVPKGEVLVFVPLSELSRFIKNENIEKTMDTLFGTEEWREARELDTVPKRNAFLAELFANQLKQSCKWARAFEIVPADGKNSHFLFFGTNNKTGLLKMKEAMWRLDPIKGQTFRDSTLADHPVLFRPKDEVATGPLLAVMKDHFGRNPFTIEQACDFALFETPFLPTHVRKRTLKPAEKRGELEPVNPTPERKAWSYPERTRIRFVDQEKQRSSQWT